MRSSIVVAALAFTAMVASAPIAAGETILFLRHGEKPEAGLGQLNCIGLARALALPDLFAKRYGRIQAVFAPDPAWQKPDGEKEDGHKVVYDYVRPLATAEPTAIRFVLPIHADFGFEQIDKLKAALLEPAYRDATVVVVWEHKQIAKLVPEMVAAFGGDADSVPKWDGADFDAIWELRIDWSGAHPKATFAVKAQGLSASLPKSCPAP